MNYEWRRLPRNSFFNDIQTYCFYSYKPNLVSQYVVIELLLLTATGEASECINPDGFSKAVDVMKTQVIETFQDVTFSLKDIGCDPNGVLVSSLHKKRKTPSLLIFAAAFDLLT